jgi:hypothetical protein
MVIQVNICTVMEQIMHCLVEKQMMLRMMTGGLSKSIYLKVETFLNLCEWADSNVDHGQAEHQVVQQLPQLGGDHIILLHHLGNLIVRHTGISETYFLNVNLKEVHNHRHSLSLIKTNTKCLALGVTSNLNIKYH